MFGRAGRLSTAGIRTAGANVAIITIDKNRCKGCGICLTFCPQKMIVLLEGEINSLGYAPAAFSDEEGKCKGCKICAEMCPDGCIEVYK